MPCAVLDVVVTLVKAEVAANVPVVRLSACPVPFKITSGEVLSPAVSVPKPLPKIFAPVPVFPTVNPRSKMPPALTVSALTLVVVMVGLAPPVEGSASLYAGGVRAAIAASVAVAPCPTSFWLARSA